MSQKKQGSQRSPFLKMLGLAGAALLGAIAGFSASKNLGSEKNESRSHQRVNYTDTNNYDKIDLQIMRQPVMLMQCGHTFEKKHIKEYITRNNKCPTCRITTQLSSLKPNYQLKDVIEEYMVKKNNQDTYNQQN